MKNSKKINVGTLKKHLNLPFDIFICSASFEERCKVVPDKLSIGKFKHVLICENEDLKDIVSKNSDYLMKRFGSRSVKVQLSTNDPLKGADNLYRELSKLVDHKAKTVLIDITTFTHESLLILLKLLQHFYRKLLKVQFVYLSASDYSVGIPKKDKWLSKGIGEIRSILGYPGVLLPSKKIHLIVLVGFEVERAEKLIASYEPTVISLGFGRKEESISDDLHDVNIMFHTMLSQKYVNVNQFTFSCIDPIETRKAVANQVAKFSEFNVVLAAMNTKISTTGAALAAFSNENMQLCYAHANQYNFKKYSTPGNDCYLFELPIFPKFK